MPDIAVAHIQTPEASTKLGAKGKVADGNMPRMNKGLQEDVK